MLVTLSINNFVLIDKLLLDFSAGFIAITGETGAGKSIILDALALALGDRLSGQYQLQPDLPVDITAVFDVAQVPEISAILMEHTIEVADTLILRRVVTKDGRSKAFINDNLVSLNLIQMVAGFLVEVSGQHEHQNLVSKDVQLLMLDEYASNDLATLQRSHEHWYNLKQQLEKNKAEREKALQEQGYLEHVVQELSAMELKCGEEEELLVKRKLLQERHKIIEGVQIACDDIGGNSGAISKINNAQRALNKIADVVGDSLGVLDQVGMELAEVVKALETIGQNVAAEETHIDDIEERLFSLRNAARKYGVEVSGLPDYLTTAQHKLALTKDSEDVFQELTEKVNQAKKGYYNAAKKAQQVRKNAAERLQQVVSQELQELRMPHAAVLIELVEVDESAWNEAGIDKVTFKIRTNPGMAFERIDKVASGGELSRFMLAFKIALSSVKTPPVVIFDEIDVGVGGAVADSIGRKLGQLTAAQVLVITHQPQVAAHAKHHYLVDKQQLAARSIVNVRLLDQEERRQEIARMLSGEVITAESLAAAKTLLEIVA